MGTNTGLDLDFVEIVIHEDGRGADCGEDENGIAAQRPAGVGSADGRADANSTASDTAAEAASSALQALPPPGQGAYAAAKYSENRYEEFQVDVQRQKHGLGLDVDKVDGKTMLVTRVKDGPIRDWNDLRKGVGVKLGDRIIAINGVMDDVELMLKELPRQRNLNLRIIRIMEFRIEIMKTAKLGIDVDHASGSYLLVTRIKDGPVAEYNESAPHDLRLYPGDRLLEVNGIAGVGGKVQVLLEKIKTDSSLSFLVRRAPMHGASEDEYTE